MLQRFLIALLVLTTFKGFSATTPTLASTATVSNIIKSNLYAGTNMVFTTNGTTGYITLHSISNSSGGSGAYTNIFNSSQFQTNAGVTQIKAGVTLTNAQLTSATNFGVFTVGSGLYMSGGLAYFKSDYGISWETNAGNNTKIFLDDSGFAFSYIHTLNLVSYDQRVWGIRSNGNFIPYLLGDSTDTNNTMGNFTYPLHGIYMTNGSTNIDSVLSLGTNRGSYWRSAGSMLTQNSNAVNITGGYIGGVMTNGGMTVYTNTVFQVIRPLESGNDFFWQTASNSLVGGSYVTLQATNSLAGWYFNGLRFGPIGSGASIAIPSVPLANIYASGGVLTGIILSNSTASNLTMYGGSLSNSSTFTNNGTIISGSGVGQMSISGNLVTNALVLYAVTNYGGVARVAGLPHVWLTNATSGGYSAQDTNQLSGITISNSTLTTSSLGGDITGTNTAILTNFISFNTSTNISTNAVALRLNIGSGYVTNITVDQNGTNIFKVGKSLNGASVAEFIELGRRGVNGAVGASGIKIIANSTGGTTSTVLTDGGGTSMFAVSSSFVSVPIGIGIGGQAGGTSSGLVNVGNVQLVSTVTNKLLLKGTTDGGFTGQNTGSALEMVAVASQLIFNPANSSNATVAVTNISTKGYVTMTDGNNNQVTITGTTNSSANIGNNALPATPLGFLTVYLNGVAVKIPYYQP
jgi:hypothetical protein